MDFHTGKGKKSKKGRPIIEHPSARMQYNTERNYHRSNIDRSNDQDDNDHGTNDYIRDINNPGDGSDSSNFSDGDPARRRQQQQREDREKKERRKRQQVKDKCAASQQQWDKKRHSEGFSMEDAYGHASKPRRTHFDGVPVDAPINETAAQVINNEHVQSLYSDHTKKKAGRGKNHTASAFYGLEGSGSKRGRGEKHQHSPFAGDGVDDPLDVAMDRQGSNQKYKRGSHTNYTKMMGSHMDNIAQSKYGDGSMTSNRNRRKKKSKARDEVIDVDGDERIDGSGGKKRKTSQYFEKSKNSSDDSPSSSSVIQGDDDFGVEGNWDSQGSGGGNEDIMAALNASKEYVHPGSVLLRPKRDPKKDASNKQKRSTKRVSEAPIPRYKETKKDELEEYSDNDSSAGRFGESKRSSNNSNGWLDRDRGRGRTPQQKSYGSTRKKPSSKTKKKLVRQGMQQDSDTDEDLFPRMEKKMSSIGLTNTRRQTRSKSKSRKAKKKDEVIEILDSSSEEESSEDEAMTPEGRDSKPKPKRPPIGDLFTIEAARIAVGKKVFKSKCKLRFQFGAKEQYMIFSWNNTKGKEREHKVSLKQDSELLGLNYYAAEDTDNSENVLTYGVDDSMTIIAFKIRPTDANEFTIYSNSYDADSYITVEVRDNDQFLAMIEQMKQNQTLKTWFDCNPEIEFYELEEYTAALIKDTEKENNKRRRSTRLSRASTKKKGNTSEKPQLVFPFKADEEEFYAAASDLGELKQARESASAANERATIQPQDSDLNEPQAENETEKVKGSARTHYITIREDDIERLDPGEFLNDALVDFWMKWISGAPNNTHPDVHIFTSHFMSTLASDGAKAVSSWTAKKRIDIFEKKLIFVPVNSDLHWSLCVVVNPGFIANNSDNEKNGSRSEKGSFLLFLDSLNMHQKRKVAKKIYEWLNFEWKRLKKSSDKDFRQPFYRESMPLFTPKIPYQDNGCDCGVFVCRYAFNLFQMRNESVFSQFDMVDNCTDLFEDSGLFEFGMKDIARIRVEMKHLIANLSKVYLQKKKLEKAKKKSKSKSNEADGNTSSEAAEAEEPTDGGNKPEGIDESFDSIVKREDESQETSGDEGPFVPKEKENVENSSDTSGKDDEVKTNEEEDRSSSDEKSQDLLVNDEGSA